MIHDIEDNIVAFKKNKNSFCTYLQRSEIFIKFQKEIFFLYKENNKIK